MKYHITEDGPKPCTASLKDCPIGGDHYSDDNEAYEAYQTRMSNMYGKYKTLRRSDQVKVSIEPLNGGSYYGAEVDPIKVEPYRKAWVDYVGEEKAKILNDARSSRVSGSGFHVTAITPRERRKVGKSLTTPPSDSVVKMLGVGTISSGENTAWYIVCESESIDEWRSANGLPPKDFHITLGFENKDVYDKFKGKDTIIDSII